MQREGAPWKRGRSGRGPLRKAPRPAARKLFRRPRGQQVRSRGQGAGRAEPGAERADPAPAPKSRGESAERGSECRPEPRAERHAHQLHCGAGGG